MRAVALVAILAGCAKPAPPRIAPIVVVDPEPPRAAALGDALAAAITAGDLAATVDTLCRAYDQLAYEDCAPDLVLTTLAPDDVMSRIDVDTARLEIQPMPANGAGFAYWDNWSRVLTAGAWQPRALFADDADARIVAATLVASVVAHELGHHVAHSLRCEGATKPMNELRADELATPVLGALAANSRAFDRLHARMRWVGEQMIEARERAAATPEDAAVPRSGDVRAWVAARTTVPADPGAYATLHLARERRLLGEAPHPAAATEAACGAAFDRFTRERYARPDLAIDELARYAVEADDLAYALDRDGRVYVAQQSPGRAGIRIVQRAPIAAGSHAASFHASPSIELPEVSFPLALAAASPTRFAVDDGSQLVIVDGATTTHAPRPDGLGALAFDKHGALVTARATDAAHVAIGDGPAIALRSSNAWGDGALPGASAAIALLALRDDGAPVFWDPGVHAIRTVLGGDTLFTLAGGGRHYETAHFATSVALAHVVALAELEQTEAIAYAEIVRRPAPALVVRTIAPQPEELISVRPR